ncbi:arginine--tRNA ligase [Kamptonema cortianum]|nr:arginine--tRNA ligase [Oscillatoria laete-virens]MDK3159622.1 arginine--tRNA ligase [Kamptonema cortianum]MDL5050270.1 arginine--tRNA ligase [Oscillatoria amoena NRMC-F 0135]MDL5055105.1 arginine--tRNA ligase [Oscillatoria laete-virens NRMC-F 0139]
MKLVPEQIAEILSPVITKIAGRPVPVSSLVKPCLDPQFGDYQCNVAMALAKELKSSPRDIAARIIAEADVSAICDTPQIAGAGFINLRLKKEFLAECLSRMATENNLGIPAVNQPRRIVMDFSSPNVAKQMHVGHIRSTILGDTLARILRFVGHECVTDNHIGDWGTQFGKLLLGYKEARLANAGALEAALEADPVAELERLYKLINDRCEAEEKAGQSAAIEASRGELRKLQDGDPENLALWRRFIELSKSSFDRVYERLGVTFDHTLGESFYNPRLKDVVRELQAAQIARESEGAIVVFFDGDKELGDKPFLIQKSDGAALYSTTDLATLKYRLDEWKADEIIYVTDSRQQLHFKQLFATARKWGLDTRLTHVWFGTILGADNKPIKTRSGEPVKLMDLLDEAEARAGRLVEDKADFSLEQKKQIARVIGIGSLKYADLGQNRTLDYVFDWDKLLSLNGNTAPYLINAYARIRSIFRKGQVTLEGSPDWELVEPQELDLARHLLRFGELLQIVLEEYRPHILCTYLFELAQKYHSFYEHCPVLKVEGRLRDSRLRLCDLTARTLQTGLGLLGIQTVEQM